MCLYGTDGTSRTRCDIVLFVFVNIIYSTGFDPIGGIVDLVNTFLDGGFAGLLALLVFLSFLA